MEVIEIGRLQEAHGSDTTLPEHGIIIEASEDELRDLQKNFLYKQVELKEVKTKVGGESCAGINGNF